MINLKRIHQEINITATPEHTWHVLSRYGDVSNFHAGVKNSYAEKGNENQATLGAERICEIVDLGLNITLKERIIELQEGSSYRYEVYEWKNFPLRKMFFTFSIRPNNNSQSVLTLDIDYKAKPAFLTALMAGKMNRLARDVLLGYKHFIETSESRIPIKQLKSRYKSSPYIEVQYDY